MQVGNACYTQISSTFREKSLTVGDQTAIARQINSTIRKNSLTCGDQTAIAVPIEDQV